MCPEMDSHMERIEIVRREGISCGREPGVTVLRARRGFSARKGGRRDIESVEGRKQSTSAAREVSITVR